eukprot:NODE_183_length_15731_cov_0.226778.p5 type:complete len:306 gc:universal NODE_183_length_15731_cov_0.226778:6888-7805(+)
MSHVLRLASLGIGYLAIVCIGHIGQILSLAVYWNYSLFYRINSRIVGFLWGLAQLIFERINGAKVTFSSNVGSFNSDGSSGFIMCNHLSYSDWYLLHAFAIRANILGYLRYFAKDALKYVPLFGWGMWIMGMIFVKRNNGDIALIQKQFAQFEKCKDPVYIVSFLEGTRKSPLKLKQSQEYCKTRNLPVLKNLLFPRYKGFISTVQALRSKGLDKIYDLTIGYYHIPTQTVNEIIPLIHTLNSRNPKEWRFHVHFKEYLVSDLPADDLQLKEWVIQRFIEKDELISQWCIKFPDESTGAKELKFF